MPYKSNDSELEILKFWNEKKIFEKSVEQRPENRPYVFYDGPPFATGLPHYGHILSSVIKDIVPRYWTMKGYRVRRRWGWDCHGLPIENIVEKELIVSGKKQIEETVGVAKFNETCQSKVLTYTKEWKKMIDRIGRWIEFDNAYKTMDSTYMESVWWALKTIWDKGLIYEGRKVLMYCPRCETPISKAEVAMDNSYKNIIEEAITVKFKILDSKELNLPENTYMLAWTTTPWTLPGNTALYVATDAYYALVKLKDEHYIVGKNRLMNYFDGKKFEVLQQFRGRDLVGVTYQPFFDIPAMKETKKRAWYVDVADFVGIDDGTGIVHSAVMYGEEDYEMALKQDLPQVSMLDSKGFYTDVVPKFLQGQYYKDAERDIKKELEQRGLLFLRESYTHSYPHCWRCDTQLFYNAIGAWFINIQKIKKLLIKLNEKINWYPDHLKHGRFLNILETAPDWNISRNRYWATPLPFWKCSGERGTGDEGRCDHVTCIGSVQEMKEKAINFNEVYKTDKVRKMDLHKHLADKIKLKCDKCGSEMMRIPEVIDCWVESGSMPFAEFHYPFENEEIFKKHFPGQYIGEYVGQVRAWFYYMHAMAVLLFDDISFENCVVTGNILNDKGEKLSKSKRNFIDPWAIIEQYGVDSLRYYLMTSTVMQAEDMFFNDREIRDIYNKVFNILWNVLTFYEMFANGGTRNKEQGTSENLLDKWILVKLQVLIRDVTEHMDNYDTVRACRPIKEFVDELSTWYVRRSRDRFKGKDELDKQNALATLHYVLLTLSKVMAPFTPFIAERIYLQLKTNNKQQTTKESVHLEEWPTADIKIETKILEEMEKVRKIVEMGLALRSEANIKVRQPLSKFTAYGLQLTAEMEKIVAEELNVKEIVSEEVSGDGWIMREDSGLEVALNIEITDELKKEGLVREIVRTVNQMRKEQKLTINDLVKIEYSTQDEVLKSVFEEYNEEIKRHVLADELKEGEHGEEKNIDGMVVYLSVHK